MKFWTGIFIFVALTTCTLESHAQSDETVAIIGTGDVGNSLGPKLAEIGYRVVYGSRDPSRDSVRALVKKTGPNATAYYIDEPQELGRRPSNLIAANDRDSKETVAKIAHAIGQDPFDAGPLRMSRAIEAQTLLFMVPLYQRRAASWENVTARTSYWFCFWGDDWSVPVADADDLAEFPDHGQRVKKCSEYPSER